MEMSKLKEFIQENNIIDRDNIAAKTASQITKIVKDIEHNGKVDLTDPQTLTYVLSKTVSEAISTTLEECIPALSSALCTQMKDEIKQEVMDETKAHLHMQSKTIEHVVTKKFIKAKYDVDKHEAYDRRLNRKDLYAGFFCTSTFGGADRAFQSDINAPSLATLKRFAAVSWCLLAVPLLITYNVLIKKIWFIYDLSCQIYNG